MECGGTFNDEGSDEGAKPRSRMGDMGCSDIGSSAVGGQSWSCEAPLHATDSMVKKLCEICGKISRGSVARPESRTGEKKVSPGGSSGPPGDTEKEQPH
jgi:hypothetical protein